MTEVPRDAADTDYFEQIESCFARLRGTPLLLSPKDWALVARWHKEGVPLRVVLEALESVFLTRRRSAGEGTPRAILSLGYCRHAVQEAFDVWREARLGAPSGGDAAAGSGSESGKGDAADCLRGWIDELQLAGRNPELPGLPMEEATENLRRLAAMLEAPDAPSLAQVEEQLEQTEDRMLDQLLQTLPPEVMQEIEASARQDLHALRPRLTRRAYESTFRVHQRGHLRARLHLPRLTLY
jgi:hypothetical protein